MSNTIKLNIAGFHQLRTSPAMDRVVLEAAEKVAAHAGEGFEAQLSPGKNRARAVVVPVTMAAARDTAKNPHHLVSALDAARD